MAYYSWLLYAPRVLLETLVRQVKLQAQYPNLVNHNYSLLGSLAQKKYTYGGYNL